MGESIRSSLERMLSGSYTCEGVQRWFERPRSWLDGKTPQQVLESGDEALIQKVRQHAIDLMC